VGSVTWTMRLDLRFIATCVAAGLSLVLAGCTAGASPPATPAVAATASRTATAQATTSPQARTPAPGAQTVSATSAAQTATPAPAPLTPAGIVLLQDSGDNPPGTNCCTVDHRTRPFDSPGSWDLNWNYDCGRLGRPGNFGIDVYRGDGSFVSLPPSVNEIGASGQGTRSYTRPGTYYLVINSVCRWSLSVVTSGRPTSTPGPAAQAGAPVGLPIAPTFAVPTPPQGAAPAPATPAAIAPPPPAAANTPLPAAVPTLTPGAPASATP
jgi:hypothetical protein